MNLTNYIVFHDQDSLEWFIEHNPDTWTKFEFIFVGENYDSIELPSIPYGKGITINIANRFENNIEHYPSLLTFTAWYLLANNDICQTDYVGIFEYDVIFKEYPNPELKDDTIYGFMPRKLPDPMYLKCIPQITQYLSDILIKRAENKLYWNTTSNFIMPMTFLKTFVKWYMNLINKHNVLSMNKHSHFHERLVNYFANYIDNIETLNIIEHKQLCSHGVQL